MVKNWAFWDIDISDIISKGQLSEILTCRVQNWADRSGLLWSSSSIGLEWQPAVLASVLPWPLQLQHTPSFPISRDRRGGRRGWGDCDTPYKCRRRRSRRRGCCQPVKHQQQCCSSLVSTCCQLFSTPAALFQLDELRLRKIGSFEADHHSKRSLQGSPGQQQARPGESWVMLVFYISLPSWADYF